MDHPVDRQYVYLFEEIERVETAAAGNWEAVRRLLGGKGANLFDLTRLGIPVPPGFTVTTEGCNAFLAAENMPDTMWEQVLAALRRLEELTGKRFGQCGDPLLVSCRSGAVFSMPGMMDTVLNIGLNDEITEAVARRSGDPRFAYDLYRRLLQMFGNVVLGVPDEPFEVAISACRDAEGARSDTELPASAWQSLCGEFKHIIRDHAGRDFPQNPREQLRLAVEAVFRSWHGKRARDYREAAGIPHDLGTAVNVQAMVFGNTGMESATGVIMTRNATTGEPVLEGDYLVNAQGEDVVAGIRATLPIGQLATDMPERYAELEDIAQRLERHYRNMQDMEFTIERGKLWMLQTRNGKRTAQAEVRIAADMAEEGVISREEAVLRVTPEQVDFFLHPQLEAAALADLSPVGGGLNVSPGAAVGIVAFDPGLAERWAREEGKKVILARPETRPDDVHGMLAAQGVITSRGGRTSHAALVARQFGKPAVVGIEDMDIDLDARVLRIGADTEIPEGAWLSIDGNTGLVYEGQLRTVVPDIKDPHLLKILEWADGFRTLGVRANADYPADARRAREYGAAGIGLCRTEHMFFEEERLPIMRQMIMAATEEEQAEAIDCLMPMQRTDFEGLFRAMDGLPVIIRLLDPPLHEFLPSEDEIEETLEGLKRRTDAATAKDQGELAREIAEQEKLLARVEELQETNPMIGTRGVRVGLQIPGLYRMQVRAIFDAACRCAAEGIEVHPEVMIPLISDVGELRALFDPLREESERVMAEHGLRVPGHFGTMIEIPRAALTAREIAEVAEFFSFGTNDLTQTVFGISRDDAETGFLVQYMQTGLFKDNPFNTLDAKGVGRLMRFAVREGRATRHNIEIGVCGEHGGDPRTIHLCQDMGIDYVSCSPYRVPIARLTAAHAALMQDSQ